ncbi:alpha-L-fucosidase [Paenibacillus spongiae]|uniref:Alpha-L-fucosidase n=1 Tax=Paenibacillus spongiae TaxID=2909671 RepID=A0ABY5SEZ3_9BACL|nr:alpha-L-fucosidase [Paenibacillus spongiae]UVI31248.1 alpha-L-fucosidase [Paenibacillus spongiae]
MGNPNTDWLKEAKYGISHHFLSNYINRVASGPEEQWKDTESWDDVIDGFDAAGYARQVAESGAGFVLLTLGQNSGYHLSPNAAYDRIAGLQPGERCSRRDLPMDIADALEPYGIRLMLYLPVNPPHSAHQREGDYAVTKAFGYTPGMDGAPSQETQEKWQAVIREWSDRYGAKLAGWWFDGLFPHVVKGTYDDPSNRYNYGTLAEAARSGNANRIITFNPGVELTNASYTPYEDYSAGETNAPGHVPSNGRWVDAAERIQYFIFTFLGSFDPYWAGWGNKGVNFDTKELTGWVKEVTDKEGSVCLDTKVNRFGQIDPQQLEQLKAIKATIRG